MQSQALCRAPNCRWSEVSAFEQERRCRCAYFGIHAAHHAGERHWSIAVADQQIFMGELALDAVKGRELAVLASAAHDDLLGRQPVLNRRRAAAGRFQA